MLDKITASVPGVGIGAEIGVLLRWERPRKRLDVDQLESMWKGTCRDSQLRVFTHPVTDTERTPSSFIEERDASMARRQAAEAQNHISLGEPYGIRIIPSANSFLVLPTIDGGGCDFTPGWTSAVAPSEWQWHALTLCVATTV